MKKWRKENEPFGCASRKQSVRLFNFKYKYRRTDTARPGTLGIIYEMCHCAHDDTSVCVCFDGPLRCPHNLLFLSVSLAQFVVSFLFVYLIAKNKTNKMRKKKKNIKQQQRQLHDNNDA